MAENYHRVRCFSNQQAVSSRIETAGSKSTGYRGFANPDEMSAWLPTSRQQELPAGLAELPSGCMIPVLHGFRFAHVFTLLRFAVPAGIWAVERARITEAA